MTHLSSVFDQFKEFICLLWAFISWVHLMRYLYYWELFTFRDFTFSKVCVNDQRQTVLSFPIDAIFFPDDENLTCQTSSLCLVSTAMHLDGIICFEHTWSSSKECYEECTLWNLQLCSWKAIACLMMCSRRLG